jgi:hypothetical protein
MVVHYQTIDVDVISPTEITSLLNLSSVPLKKGTRINVTCEMPGIILLKVV